MYGISFNIVYNELGKENIKNVEYPFSQSSGKNINHLKTDLEGHETVLCCHTHIYLSNRTLQIQIIS